MRNFGVEVEVAGGTADILSHLRLDGLHSYHCGCGRCDPFRSGPDWTGQQDCTSDGEFVSRVLTYGADGTDALNDMGAALAMARADHICGNSGHQVNGVHVHVAADDILNDNLAMARLWRLYFTHHEELADIASGSYRDVRGYNPDCRLIDIVGDDFRRLRRFWARDPRLFAGLPRLAQPYGRTWLNTRTGHQTVEWRLWNATRATWRLHLYVGVSVALTHLASDEDVRARPDDGVSLFDRIHHLLTPESAAAYVRYLYAKEIVR